MDEMTMQQSVPTKQAARQKDVIAVSEYVDFIRYKNLKRIPARIDTGARTSSLWASKIRRDGDAVNFVMFGPGSPFYTGKRVRLPLKEIRYVTSSTGHEQARHVVELSIRVRDRRFKAKFTLADRSTQSYPILIGRNTLRGNFLVDASDPGEAAIYKYPEEAKEYTMDEAV